MRTTLDYLNDAKKALQIESDYGLAKWLGVTKQAVSSYKLGKSIIDDYAAAKIADALGIDPLEVIAVANLERSEQKQEGERSDYWRKVFERCAAAVVLIFLAIPDGYGATAKHFPADNNNHYAQLRRPRRKQGEYSRFNFVTMLLRFASPPNWRAKHVEALGIP